MLGTRRTYVIFLPDFLFRELVQNEYLEYWYIIRVLPWESLRSHTHDRVPVNARRMLWYFVHAYNYYIYLIDDRALNVDTCFALRKQKIKDANDITFFYTLGIRGIMNSLQCDTLQCRFTCARRLFCNKYVLRACATRKTVSFGSGCYIKVRLLSIVACRESRNKIITVFFI